MDESPSPEERVMRRFFQRLHDDETFPETTLRELERLRKEGKLSDPKQIQDAFRRSGERNAQH
jgi:hypothetical protein